MLSEYRLEAEIFHNDLKVWLYKGGTDVCGGKTIRLWPERSIRKRMDKAAEKLIARAKRLEALSATINEFNRYWKGMS